MCVLCAPSLAVWTVGSSVKQMIRKGSSYLGYAFSLSIRPLASPASHLAPNSVQVYLRSEHLEDYLMGRFGALLPSKATSSTELLSVPDFKQKVS